MLFFYACPKVAATNRVLTHARLAKQCVAAATTYFRNLTAELKASRMSSILEEDKKQKKNL